MKLEMKTTTGDHAVVQNVAGVIVRDRTLRIFGADALGNPFTVAAMIDHIDTVATLKEEEEEEA